MFSVPYFSVFFWDPHNVNVVRDVVPLNALTFPHFHFFILLCILFDFYHPVVHTADLFSASSSLVLIPSCAFSSELVCSLALFGPFKVSVSSLKI